MTEETREQVNRAAEVLKEAGATAVYLFGSVAEGRDTPDSDLDLAVSGIPPRQFFRAIGNAMMAVSRNIDVIDLDHQDPFTEFLEKEGKLLRVA